MFWSTNTGPPLDLPSQVLDFDSFDPQLLELLHSVCRRHGLPVGLRGTIQGAHGDERSSLAAYSASSALPAAVLHTSWQASKQPAAAAVSLLLVPRRVPVRVHFPV